MLVESFKPTVGTPHPIDEIVLIPSTGGRFEVSVDGELIYSKIETGAHPPPELIVERVRSRL